MPVSSAMQATKYSKYVSLMGVKALEHSLNIKDTEFKNKNCNGCSCKNREELNELVENMCYACRHIIQDLVSKFNIIYYLL